MTSTLINYGADRFISATLSTERPESSYNIPVLVLTADGQTEVLGVNDTARIPWWSGRTARDIVLENAKDILDLEGDGNRPLVKEFLAI